MSVPKRVEILIRDVAQYRKENEHHWYMKDCFNNILKQLLDLQGEIFKENKDG